MLYLIYTFLAGFCIPFISRRLGKILPATTGVILFQLLHFPRFPHAHNPLQHALFCHKWKQLLIAAMFLGLCNAALCFCAHQYLPSNLFPYSVFFIWVMLCAADVDMRYLLLPDCLTLPLLMVGFLFALQTDALTPIQSLYGSFFAYTITALSVFVVSFMGSNLFGAGDSKMAIALGAWLGIQGLNYAIFLSFFVFVIYAFFAHRRSGAYGPALGLASLFSFFILYIK